MPSRRSPYGRGSRAKTCDECGEAGRPDDPISARALHISCGQRRRIEHARQMRERSGPYYEAWVDGIVAHAHQLIGR